MLIAERILSALPSDGFIKTDNAVELFDLIDTDTSHSFERCHVNVAVGCNDILQDRQLHSHLEEQSTLTVIGISYQLSNNLLKVHICKYDRRFIRIFFALPCDNKAHFGRFRRVTFIFKFLEGFHESFG